MYVIDFSKYILPLSVVVAVGDGRYELTRYAGVGFYVGPNGLIATCKHIVESTAEGERLIGQNLATGAKTFLRHIRVHPDADFALANVDHSEATPAPRFLTGEQLLGLDVQALGFVTDGKVGKDFKIISRMFKGSVVRHDTQTRPPGGQSTVELSFPSHKGFSGAPVVAGTSDDGPVIAGMLFSNAESTIELYSYTEIEDSGSKFREQIHRVVELGLMHPAEDILRFMSELAASVRPE